MTFNLRLPILQFLRRRRQLWPPLRATRAFHRQLGSSKLSSQPIHYPSSECPGGVPKNGHETRISNGGSKEKSRFQAQRITANSILRVVKGEKLLSGLASKADHVAADGTPILKFRTSHGEPSRRHVSCAPSCARLTVRPSRRID